MTKFKFGNPVETLSEHVTCDTCEKNDGIKRASWTPIFLSPVFTSGTIVSTGLSLKCVYCSTVYPVNFNVQTNFVAADGKGPPNG